MQNKDYPNLLNCPFCGNKPRIKNGVNSEGKPYFQVIHDCPNLWNMMETFCYATEKAAIERWNTRTPDISISPDRLQEICEAEREGRVVVIPCMVGDTVYALQSMRISELCVDPLHKEIVTAKVIEITLKDGIEWLRLYSDDDRIADYRGTEWGKTVFLSREQAEAALKGAKE